MDVHDLREYGKKAERDLDFHDGLIIGLFVGVGFSLFGHSFVAPYVFFGLLSDFVL